MSVSRVVRTPAGGLVGNSAKRQTMVAHEYCKLISLVKGDEHRKILSVIRNLYSKFVCFYEFMIQF